MARALAAHPEDNVLASGSNDTTVLLWRFSTAELLRKLTGHTMPVHTLAFSRDWLLSGSDDRTVRVWAWKTGLCARVLDDFVRAPRFTSIVWQGSRMITLDADSLRGPATMRLWNTSSADPRTWSCVVSLEKVSSPLLDVVVLDDGRVVCVAPGSETTIAVWHV